MDDLTPAEHELYELFNKSATDGKVTNMHCISMKHCIPYDHTLRYKKRLELKGAITSNRCGLGCKCPVTVTVNKNIKL